jgi:hypothetical protein
VIDSLAAICAEVKKHSVEKSIPVDLLWEYFGTFDPQAGLSHANTIRTTAGGDVYSPTATNDLLRKLQVVATSVYPLFLIPPSREFPITFLSPTRAIHSHPIAKEVTETLAYDPDLQNLYPADSSSSGAAEGDGDDRTFEFARFFAPKFIEAIITYAYDSALCNLRRTPSAEECCREIPKAVNLARSLSRGKSALLPVVISLANIKLPQDVVIESPVGKLAPYEKIYDRWIHRRIQRDDVHQESDQGRYTFYGAGDIVLHARIRFRLKVTVSPENVTGWQLIQVKKDEIESRQTIACLAATLGVAYEVPIAVDPVWGAAFSPIMTGLPGVWLDRGRVETRGPRRVLSVEEASSWQEWIARINKAGLGKLDIGARRLQSAIAERTSPVDQFVDSVIVWENLFGSGNNVLRIPASMAWLLAEDAEERLALQRELAALYGRRSAVVHGGAHISDSEAAESANRAVQVGIGALRKMYLEYPQMIHSTAAKRSLSMILQAPGQADQPRRSTSGTG